VTTNIKIGFTEQSKCVTASVSVESDEGIDCLEKAKELYDKAKEFSSIQTLAKQR
jgi:hypothetical protein